MAPNDQKEAVAYRILDEHLVLVSVLVYALASVPVYFWLVGEVGDAGQIKGGIVIASLVTGSLMFVPAIMSYLRNKKFSLGYAQTGSQDSSTEEPVR